MPTGSVKPGAELTALYLSFGCGVVVLLMATIREPQEDETFAQVQIAASVFVKKEINIRGCALQYLFTASKATTPV